MITYSISALYIYPIKGLGGISLHESKVHFRGLEYDRSWMLIDADTNNFISQRTYPQMALFSLQIDANSLIVNYNSQELSIPLTLIDKASPIQATVWDDTILCYEVKSEYSEWFSNLLNLKCKLVKVSEDSIRNKTLTEAPHTAPLAFADGYPILLLGTSSMKELNSKCPIPIDSNRFRANILIETNVPHEEDNFGEISTYGVNKAVLKVIKPCVRCQVIGIDQSTATSSKEPIKTLAEYRSQDNKIIFGANTICLKEGNISIGDIMELNLSNSNA
jgi:uncharacterized protein